MNSYAEKTTCSGQEGASKWASAASAFKVGISNVLTCWHQYFTIWPMTRPFSNRSDVMALELPEGERYAEFYHESVRGFGVKVTKEGRFYIYRTKVPHPDNPKKRKNQRYEIGDVSEWRFDDAMREALRLRGNARTARMRNQPAEVLTLKAGYEAYLNKQRKRPLSTTTREDYDKRWKQWLEAWADLPMAGITAAQWNHLHNKMLAPSKPGGKTRRATANGVITLVKAIYGWQIKQRALAYCPVDHIEYDAPPTRKTHIAPKDWSRVWAWLHTRVHPGARDYILVGWLTGMRESILGAMRWDKGPVQVDVERRLLLIDKDAKGNKAKVDIQYPICDELWGRVFGPRLGAKSGPFVIPSNKRAGFPLRSVKETMKAMAKGTGVRISDHDLRRTSATAAHKAGLDVLMVKRLLSHKDAKVEGAEDASGYVQTCDEDLRAAANKLGAYIIAQCTQVTPEPTNSSSVA